MFSIPVARPLRVTVWPQAVITAARAGPSASTRLPADSLRRSSHQALQTPSLFEGLGKSEQKRMRSTCQPLIFHWPRFLSQGTVMACKGWSPTTLSPPPSNAWRLLLLPSQPPAQATSSIPSLVSSKGSCVVPPAPIEVGTTNCPFIPAVVPSAQRRSPCAPVRSPSSMPKKNIFFFPHEKQPTCSNFHPQAIFCPSLVYCLFLQENIPNKRDQWWQEDNTGASIQPDSCSYSTSHQ